MCGDGTNDVGALKHAHIGGCLPPTLRSLSPLCDPPSLHPQSASMVTFSFFLGVALLANAPERIPEKKKRSREKDSSTVEFRPAPPVSTGGKLSSRTSRQRAMAHKEEQLAAPKVGPHKTTAQRCHYKLSVETAALGTTPDQAEQF